MDSQAREEDRSAERSDVIAGQLRALAARDVTCGSKSRGVEPVSLLRMREFIQREYQVSMSLRQLGERYNDFDALAAHIAAILPRDGAGAGTSSDRTHQDDGAATRSETSVRQRYLRSFVDRYTSRTRRSKELAQQYRAVLADRRTSTGFKLSTKELVYPIVAAKSAGARFWDVDGNEYVDIVMGFGTLLFGHRAPFVVDAAERQIGKGVHVGPQSELAGKVAELICRISGTERAAFTVTGSEAVMTALRLARAKTGRAKIVMFEGCWHGGYDATLMTSENGHSLPMFPGVPESLADDVVVLEFGSQSALDSVERLGPQLAAVLLEPVQSGRPSLQPLEFVQELRRITQNVGAALIFDELITGFRAGLGGMQEWYGICADMVTYGKSLGSGFPIGVVAGRHEYLDLVDGGFWTFGDSSYPGAETTWVGWTYGKHPLSMAVAYAVLLELESRGSELLEGLNRRTAALVEKLNDYFRESDTAIRVPHFSSFFRFECSQFADLFFYHLILNGIYVTDSQRLCFLSLAHTDEDLNRIVLAVKQTVIDMKSGNFLRSRSSASRET